MYACMSIHIHTYIHIYLYLHIYICIHGYIYIYIYINTYGEESVLYVSCAQFSLFAATSTMAAPGGVLSRIRETVTVNAQKVLPPSELLHHTAGCFLDRGAMSTALHYVFDNAYIIFV